MTTVRNDALSVALDAGENPYLLGPYAPVDEEIQASDLEVEGEIPSDLEGMYVRNGPNPRYRTGIRRSPTGSPTRSAGSSAPAATASRSSPASGWTKWG